MATAKETRRIISAPDFCKDRERAASTGRQSAAEEQYGQLSLWKKLRIQFGGVVGASAIVDQGAWDPVIDRRKAELGDPRVEDLYLFKCPDGRHIAMDYPHSRGRLRCFCRELAPVKPATFSEEQAAA